MNCYIKIVHKGSITDEDVEGIEKEKVWAAAIFSIESSGPWVGDLLQHKNNEYLVNFVNFQFDYRNAICVALNWLKSVNARKINKQKVKRRYIAYKTYSEKRIDFVVDQLPKSISFIEAQRLFDNRIFLTG